MILYPRYDKYVKSRLAGNIGSFKNIHLSIIIKKKSVIAFGENKVLPNTNIFWTIHAEVNALTKLPVNRGKLIDIDLIVLRLYKDGTFSYSKPCEHCINYMKNIIKNGYRINTVLYSNHDGFIESIKLNNIITTHISKHRFK
jgi:deoxycytidylate deaminase